METTDGDTLRSELESQPSLSVEDLEQRIRDAAPYKDPKKTKPLGRVTRQLDPSELFKTGPLERVRASIKSFINRIGPPTDPNDPQAILARHEREARGRGTPAYFDRVNAAREAERQRKHGT